MRSIYRYELSVRNPVLELPVGAAVLSVAPSRSGDPSVVELWAIVNTTPGAPTERVGFCVVGTGHPLPDDLLGFVGTVITAGGALVWHVFQA